MDWIYSSGGPLILMDKNSLHDWGGCLKLGGSTADKEYKTDYERACAIDDYLGVISVNGSDALVVNDEPLQTTIWHQDEIAFLVRWEWAADEGDVEHLLKELGNASLISLSSPKIFRANSSDFILFDSACLGEDSVEKLDLKLTKSLYEVTTMRYQHGTKISLILHKFCPILDEPA